MPRRDDPEGDASRVLESLRQPEAREVHHHYHNDRGTNGSKNGNGNGVGLNTVLLGCLLAIIGFLGVQLWGINGRLTAAETNITTLLARP